MANRLTRIYTRGGDTGTTGLANGKRVSKSSARISALGDIDELNSSLGVLLADLNSSDELFSLLRNIQNELFDLGGELAMDSPDYQAIDDATIKNLESQLDQLNEPLPALTEFILPGGNRPAALCQLSRSICRRAERSFNHLCEEEEQNRAGARYLNRLSDLLFVVGRSLAKRDQNEEVFWKPRLKR